MKGGEGSEAVDEDVEEAEDEDKAEDDDSIVKLWSPKAEGRGPALALSTTVTIGGKEAPVDADAADAAEAPPAVGCPVFCSCSSAWRNPLAYCSCSSVTFFGKRN